MSENDPFIRAIAGDPANDTSRLIYADWLDEHGDPHAADYLRTELALAKLPLDSPPAPALRRQLWRAWAKVDPRWLLIFTQPRMLRANPTPFPSAWMSFGLGNLREGQGTYGTWPYDSVPPLQLDDLRGGFQYLDVRRVRPAQGEPERHRGDFERMVADADRLGVHLPDLFVSFMKNQELHNTFRSVTDCFFAFPDELAPIRSVPVDDGESVRFDAAHVHFYCDSQSWPLWDLYVHSSGAHCVIARWPDFFDPDVSDPDDGPDEDSAENLDGLDFHLGPDKDDDQAPHAGPRAWFVAPSFEAFVYRVWLENQVWYIEHSDFVRQQGGTPPPITPAIQAYIDHYRNRQTTTGPKA